MDSKMIDVENMTVRQVRELAESLAPFIGHNTPATVPEAGQRHVHEGRYCVFRGYRTGVYVGKLVGSCMGGEYFVVQDARRVQYQQYNGFTLCSVAISGLASGSKLSPAVPLQTLRVDDICEVFACSESAERNIREQPDGTA